MNTIETEARTIADPMPGHEPAPAVDSTHPAFPPDMRRIDLASPDFRDDAFRLYEEMRAECPVSRAIITSSDGGEDAQALLNRPVWLVTDYEEGNRALLDRAITVDFASVLTPEQIAQFPETPEEFKPLQRNILTVDPPEHTRLRKLVQPSFTASAIEKLRPRIQRITDALLEAAEAAAAERGEAAPDRTMELIAQFAYPLPITVISEMLGIPAEDREKTHRWSENLLTSRSQAGQEEVRRDIADFIAYLRELFAKKREQPGDDMISQLLQVEVEGDRLTEDETLAMVFILFIAGHVTTVNLIANGVYALLTNPGQAEKLRHDPSLAANAVEEVLRYYGPAESTTARFVREEIELGGQTLAKGDPLLVLLAAADRDPARFSDPNTFDISREDANRHIAFGKGIHACLGAPLARVEGQIALETLFRRYPGLKLGVPVEEISWSPSFLRGLSGLPVQF